MTNHSPIAVRLSASSLFVVGLFERVGKTIPRISGYYLDRVLVYYTHRRVGLTIPRNTRGQLEKAHPVQLSRIRPGDLLFFRLSWRKVSHVGIYPGNNRFIHASSGGKGVSYANIENAYWKKRLIAAGRYF